LRKDNKFQALVGRHERAAPGLLMPQASMKRRAAAPVQMLAGFSRSSPRKSSWCTTSSISARHRQDQAGGGIAGHNGLKDISQRLATHDMAPAPGGRKPPARNRKADYVLQRPTAEERGGSMRPWKEPWPYYRSGLFGRYPGAIAEAAHRHFCLLRS